MHLTIKSESVGYNSSIIIDLLVVNKSATKVVILVGLDLFLIRLDKDVKNLNYSNHVKLF